jgi:branched-chain amino acid transport system permease protein
MTNLTEEPRTVRSALREDRPRVTPQLVTGLLGAAASVLLLLAPVLLAESEYTLRVVTKVLVFAIAAYGMNVILGFTGQLSLAHAGFFGMGAYVVGVLTTVHDWSFWLAFLVAVAGTTAVGFTAGLLALRTRAEYFAIYTMACGFVIYLVVSRWKGVTNGLNGIIGVKLPEGGGLIDFADPAALYYLILLVLGITIYATWAIRRSTVGRTLFAIRTSEDLAKSIGVNVGLNKQLAFTASTMIAGTAGALYATAMGFIGPADSSVHLTFEMLMFLLIGGMGTVFGPLIGTFLVVFLFETLQDFQSYRFLVIGPVIVALVIFAPRGIAGYYQSLIARLFRRTGSAATKSVKSTAAGGQPRSTVASQESGEDR